MSAALDPEGIRRFLDLPEAARSVRVVTGSDSDERNGRARAELDRLRSLGQARPARGIVRLGLAQKKAQTVS